MILVLSGSGKRKDSNSAYFQERVTEQLREKLVILSIGRGFEREAAIRLIEDADVFFFSQPLYVDAMSSGVLEFMMLAEKKISEDKLKKRIVYLVSNCGFYEPEQNRHTVQIMKNWCVRCGLIWGQAVLIGCGEMFGAMRKIPFGYGPTKSLKFALDVLAENITERQTADDLYVHPAYIPRWMFMQMANRFWIGKAKQNKLHKKDLSKKWIKE